MKVVPLDRKGWGAVSLGAGHAGNSQDENQSVYVGRFVLLGVLMLEISGQEDKWWVVASVINLPFSFNSELHCFKRGAQAQIDEIEKAVPSMKGKLEPVAVKVRVTRCTDEETAAFDAKQADFLAKRNRG